MHLEFVVLGPPISNRSKGPNLTAWQATVKAEAKKHWNGAILEGHIKAILINFYATDEPSVDVDNMAKPVFDSLEEIVYGNDRQVTQAEISHVRIDSPFVLVGASPVLVSAIRAGNHFVYVRIEDPVAPFPLPK